AVQHYAIIGSSFSLGVVRTWGQVVLELMPDGPRVRSLGRDEVWQTEPIRDLIGARIRIRELTGSEQKHRYDAISNNCEHWARYIAFGESRSEQVSGIATAVL